MAAKGLESDARRRIYAYLKEAPGAHFSQVQRELGLATGTLQYHLRYLQKKGLVDERSDGKYTRYFPSLDIDRRWKPALGLLRQPTPRRIVVDLLEHRASRLNDLAERTGVPPSTLSFHLAKLIKADVVAKVERGTYDVTDPDALVGLLAEFRAGFLDSAVDRVVRLFTGVKRGPSDEARASTDGPDEGRDSGPEAERAPRDLKRPDSGFVRFGLTRALNQMQRWCCSPRSGLPAGVPLEIPHWRSTPSKPSTSSSSRR